MAARTIFKLRPFLAMVYDLTVATGVWLALTLFKTSAGIESLWSAQVMTPLVIVVAIEFGCFLWFGLYQGIWRYASLHDLRRIAYGIGSAALIIPGFLLLLLPPDSVPRSFFIFNPLLLLLFMAGGRMVYRWYMALRPSGLTREEGRPLLLLGAGETALALVEQLDRSRDWQVVGLLDDNPNKQGRTLAGVHVLGAWEELSSIAVNTSASHALLAMSNVSHHVRRKAFELCRNAGVQLMIMPGIDAVESTFGAGRIRDVDVSDLLGRDPVELNTAGLKRFISGRVVMVTGAGGSIGSELCRQLVRFGPSLIILFELSELALYQITEEFVSLHPEQPVKPIIGDVKDAHRLDQVLQRYRPELVFHAAAYKHVPLMEETNAWQAMMNNTLGSLRLIQACIRHPVSKLIYISTDKAVNPTSVMGASKRIGEMLLQHWHLRANLPCVMVRFGNVLGSTGSVIPKFKEQIARGGPITITHAEMKRYFMSIPEASQLVLQSAMMGGEAEIYMLDMGEPVRIVDLARDMIRLSGFSEDEIPIEFIGLRPGEKLTEELHLDDETTLPTPHSKLRVLRPIEPPGQSWERKLSNWLEGEPPLSDEAVRAGLLRFLPDYRPAPGLETTAVQQSEGETLLDVPTPKRPALVPVGEDKADRDLSIRRVRPLRR